ncbi:hypothetical protein [Rhodovibrio salinarum]|uniref:VPLPA-CTERM protein sorting domain-containing protein n=1 Tax=Rhodovibrio salinarum TaxID=1087 RepID=A0A934QGB2_9PROT|nr:hypothetical protein [Rhodovibrio salinarum]MBK1696249.1 hypothetical protein [Rhodovibrio salinarum]
MHRTFSALAMATVMLAPFGAAHAAAITLYDQDFENPASYNNDGGDVNIFDTVNDNYGNQPAGFAFAQTNTVETLNVSGSHRGAGSAAFGTGWSDPAGVAGDFAIGMLSDAEDDRLGLSFDVGAFPFFNVFIDISSIDLTTFGGPFVPSGVEPIFRFTLFDNPTGTVGIGGGMILDSFDLAGTPSAPDTFDFTSGAFGLSTTGNSNGNVTLQIDLLQGGYAAFDNLTLQASSAPPPQNIPLPPSLLLLLSGLAAVGIARVRTRRPDAQRVSAH